MSPAFTALLVGIAATTWIYVKLAKYNGNANPGQNFILAGVAGFVVFLVIFTLLKFTFNF